MEQKSQKRSNNGKLKSKSAAESERANDPVHLSNVFKKPEAPKSSEKAREYLKGYSHEHSVATFEDVLNIKELPENWYESACLALEIYDILVNVISNGIDLPDKTEAWVTENIIRLRGVIWDYITREYDKISVYNLPRTASRWNTASVLAMIALTLLPIYRSVCDNAEDLKAVLPDIDIKQVMRSELVLYPRKGISNYTMMEMQNTLYCLAEKWYEVPFNDDLVAFVDHLEFRLAHIILVRQGRDVMDGNDNRDRVVCLTDVKRIAKSNSKPSADKFTFSCSSEYINDTLTVLCKARQSIYYYRHMFASTNNNLDLDIYDMPTDVTWEENNPQLLYKGFWDWLKIEADAMQGAKFKDDIKLMILTVRGKRFGDQERYIRNNPGQTSPDAQTVIDELRSPLQYVWLTNTIMVGGVPRILKTNQRYIQSLTIAKVFARYCETEMRFDWFNMCFYLENAIRRKAENILIYAAPAVVQQASEFNVYYKKAIYRTKTIEYALILWVLIMTRKCNSEFSNLRETWDLHQLKKLLKSWGGTPDTESSEEEDESEQQTIQIDTNAPDSVFEEVYETVAC